MCMMLSQCLNESMKSLICDLTLKLCIFCKLRLRSRLKNHNNSQIIYILKSNYEQSFLLFFLFIKSVMISHSQILISAVTVKFSSDFITAADDCINIIQLQ